MEVGHPIVMLRDMTPDLHGMLLAAVKGSVHKLHLGHPVFQKEIQFPFHQLQIPEPDRLIQRG